MQVTIHHKCPECRDTGLNLTDLPRLSVGAMSHTDPDGPCPACRRTPADVARERQERIREMRNEELCHELANEPREYSRSSYDDSDYSREYGPRD